MITRRAFMAGGSFAALSACAMPPQAVSLPPLALEAEVFRRYPQTTMPSPTNPILFRQFPRMSCHPSSGVRKSTTPFRLRHPAPLWSTPMPVSCI